MHVNRSGGLVGLANHGVVRLHNTLHIKFAREQDVVTTRGPDDGVIPAGLLRLRFSRSRCGVPAMLINDDRRFGVDVERLEGSLHSRRTLGQREVRRFGIFQQVGIRILDGFHRHTARAQSPRATPTDSN